ncbi:hypothetical protein JCM11491_007047 [Sporobolomyces phaffii]
MAPDATDIAALKVVDLKELLRAKGLAVSGTKAQLIARLEQADDSGPTDVDHEDAPTEAHTQRKRAPEDADPDDGDRLGAIKRTRLDDDGDGDDVLAAVETTPPALEENTNGNGTVNDQVEPPASTTDAPLDSDEGPQQTAIPPLSPTSGTARAVNERPSPPPTVDVTKTEEEEEQEEPPEYNFEPETFDAASLRPTDMYLDTIDRSALDFDFERLCSVTLSHNHIYCCLVCGKFFQGRGKKSAAYAHSIGEDHHVYINLESKKVYVLPDGYEVCDPSLSDIQYLLSPTFTPALLESIDASLAPHHDLSQSPYYPGFVGLNNIKSNSYINAILVSLAHVRPLRDYFILAPDLAQSPSELVRRFALFLKKVWNPRQFKSQVSPHELLQQIDLDSKGKFGLLEQKGDPAEFLSWFLNTLHRDLGGNRKPNSSIIYSTFQGGLEISDQRVVKSGEYGAKPQFDLARETKTTSTRFLYLNLDLPPMPLFQSHLQNDIIPQVSLATLLAKYNGQTTQELLTTTTKEGGGGGEEGKSDLTLRRYKLDALPEFVVLLVKRFKSNRFGEEKNPTIVNFPLRGVDFKDYVNRDESDDLARHYDLVSNVTHTSLAGTARSETQWKTYVHLTPPRDADDKFLAPPTTTTTREVKDEDEKWFECQDLVVQEIEKGLVGLGESYIQIWERRRPEGKHDIKVETPKPKVKGVAGQAPK